MPRPKEEYYPLWALAFVGIVFATLSAQSGELAARIVGGDIACRPANIFGTDEWLGYLVPAFAVLSALTIPMLPTAPALPTASAMLLVSASSVCSVGLPGCGVRRKQSRKSRLLDHLSHCAFC